MHADLPERWFAQPPPPPPHPLGKEFGMLVLESPAFVHSSVEAARGNRIQALVEAVRSGDRGCLRNASLARGALPRDASAGGPSE